MSRGLNGFRNHFPQIEYNVIDGQAADYINRWDCLLTQISKGTNRFFFQVFNFDILEV